jgi:uncharacterized protein YbjT (DUF2867 family)
MHSDPILVAGATGYVGGRLIPELLSSGYRVRAIGRSLEKLAWRPWADHPRIELARADVLDRNSLETAAMGCRTAFYLVHSMIAQKKRFADADRRAAHNMVSVSVAVGLERIIYLGGLAEPTKKPLSRHLQSRIEVADILRAGPVPATVLRAPMILGSGSASFEILRYLVERLPVMITPSWVNSLCQPVAIRNVLGYLLGCLKRPETAGQTYDIGGPDVVTYRKLLDIYGREANLRKRVVIPVPVLSPTFSAYWIRFVSPVPASIALPLTEGLTSNAVCSDNRIRDIIPQKLLSCREAIRLALERIDQEQVASSWTDAGDLMIPEWAHKGDADWAGGTILRCGYRAVINGTPDDLWRPIRKIGGENDWYFLTSLWRLRGMLDRLMGGVGLQRGRRDPKDLCVGDALDFWRVMKISPPRRLMLVAEMKTPGEALLEFQLNPMGTGRTELIILSRFLPRGLAGILYWYILYPFHELIFFGLIKAIADSVGKKISVGPERFTPRLHDT